MKTSDNQRTIFKLINHKYVPEYDIIKTVGEGSYGKVYLAEHRKTRKRVAVKEVRCESNEGVSRKKFDFLNIKDFYINPSRNCTFKILKPR
jgi:serine/threonine protein kinase